MEPVRVFYSYSHRDESFRDELSKHLKLLERTGAISGWHDRRVEAGGEWQDRIGAEIEEADLVLLLVSPDFLASDYCYEVEMKQAVARHEAGQARVVPIIVRPVNWRSTPFARLQALPTDGRPVSTWEDADEAWVNVEGGLRTAIEQFAQPVTPDATRLPTVIAKVMKQARQHYMLVVESGLEPGRSVDLQPGARLILGRAEESDIRLPSDDRRASRHHAWIEVTSTRMTLRDVKSKNGTYVNDRRIQKYDLHRGDRIRCGDTVVKVTEAPDPDRTDTVIV